MCYPLEDPPSQNRAVWESAEAIEYLPLMIVRFVSFRIASAASSGTRMDLKSTFHRSLVVLFSVGITTTKD